jgi:ATP-dependent Clp protease adapter protein ClpS
LLFNDQVHTFREVTALLAIATGFDLRRCLAITERVHIAGRAEVIQTDAASAERVAKVLRDGGLLAAVRSA